MFRRKIPRGNILKNILHSMFSSGTLKALYHFTITKLNFYVAANTNHYYIIYKYDSFYSIIFESIDKQKYFQIQDILDYKFVPCFKNISTYDIQDNWHPTLVTPLSWRPLIGIFLIIVFIPQFCLISSSWNTQHLCKLPEPRTFHILQDPNSPIQSELNMLPNLFFFQEQGDFQNHLRSYLSLNINDSTN